MQTKCSVLIFFNLLSDSFHCCPERTARLGINEMFHKLEMKLLAEYPKQALTLLEQEL